VSGNFPRIHTGDKDRGASVAKDEDKLRGDPPFCSYISPPRYCAPGTLHPAPRVLGLYVVCVCVLRRSLEMINVKLGQRAKIDPKRLEMRSPRDTVWRNPRAELKFVRFEREGDR
jgi:hypothetical protein